MLRINTPVAKIAEALGKCRKTIYNEIERGLCVQQTSEYEFVERYCADVAEKRYQENLRAKGPDIKLGNDYDFSEYIEDQIINKRRSPGAALAQIKIDGKEFKTHICETTLYNWIYKGVFLNLSDQDLLYKGKRRNEGKREQKTEGWARPPKGDTIEHRPEEVNNRDTFGNWEMDSVIGCKGSKAALVVLTERLTRYPMIFWVPDHTMESVVRALDRLERRMGAKFRRVFLSITVDNGSEFQDCAGMERSKRARTPRTKIYYCHPYSAYERGSNENMNRIIRRFFPKGTNFDDVTAAEVAQVEEWLANYPRRILDWATPKMLFDEQMATAA
jgi:IS30 family transposase